MEADATVRAGRAAPPPEPSLKEPRLSSPLPGEPGFLPDALGDPGWAVWFEEGGIAPSAWGRTQSGVYVMELYLREKTRIDVGALGRREFPAGRYAYVGRALRGLEARLARHLRKRKPRPRWHVDHLRARAGLLRISVLPAADASLECGTALRLLAMGGRIVVPGFGSSDCACPSHLLFLSSKGIAAHCPAVRG